MKKGTALIAIAVFLAATAAAENITEAKIESIPLTVKSGTSLEFTYTVGNREGEPCNAEIRYWIGSLEPKQTQGTDTVYLSEKEVKRGNGSLLIPSSMKGIQDFYLEMRCNEATVVANKTIEVKETVPTLTQFTSLEILESREGKQLEFTYQIKSSQEEEIAARIEEALEKDGALEWQNAQNISVAGEAQATSLGPTLKPGSYKLTVHAIHGSQTSKISREFRVSQALPAAPTGLVTAGLIAALLAIIAATGIAAARLFSQKSPLPFHRPGKDPIKSRACSVESEASGFPEELQLSRLLDDIGLTGKKRQKATLTANRAQSEQTVRSCAVTYKSGKRDFETTVTATIRNNTNRDWKNVKVLLRLPSCLEEDITDVEADCQPEILEGKPILRFRLPQIGAMQSTTITYKAGKMISQAEANSIGLPAVIGLRKSKPLVITQVKSEEMAEALAKETKKPK